MRTEASKPAQIVRWRPWIGTAAACAAALSLYLVGTAAHGLDVSPDSVHYLATARSVLSNGTFTSYDGAPYVLWPPLFPMLLAAPGVLGLDVLTSAWILNCVAVVGIVLAGSLLFQDQLRSGVAVAATAALAVSFPLHFVAGKVWSESVFILLVLLSVWSMTRYVRAPSVSWLLLAAVLSSLSMLQRTAGASVVLTGVLSILVLAPGPSEIRASASAARRFVHISAYSVIAVLPTAAWVARNLIVSGTASGPREAAGYSFAENVYLMLRTLAGWFFPNRLLVSSVVVAIAALGSAAVAVIVWAARARGELRAADARALMPAAAFVVIYLALSLVAAGSANLDPLDDRLLSPVFPFLVLFTFIVARLLREWLALATYGAVLATSVMAAAGTILCAKPALQAVRAVTSRIVDGHHDFQSARWAHSALILELRKLNRPRLLFSNRPDAVYFQTGLTTSASPVKHGYNTHDKPSDDLTDTLDAEIAASGMAYLAWFDRGGRGFVYPLEELKDMYRLQVVTEAEDGTLFSVAQLLPGNGNGVSRR